MIIIVDRPNVDSGFVDMNKTILLRWPIIEPSFRCLKLNRLLISYYSYSMMHTVCRIQYAAYSMRYLQTFFQAGWSIFWSNHSPSRLTLVHRSLWWSIIAFWLFFMMWCWTWVAVTLISRFNNDWLVSMFYIISNFSPFHQRRLKWFFAALSRHSVERVTNRYSAPSAAHIRK